MKIGGGASEVLRSDIEAVGKQIVEIDDDLGLWSNGFLICCERAIDSLTKFALWVVVCKVLTLGLLVGD